MSVLARPRASSWRNFQLRGRRYVWRAGVRTNEWTIGVRYEFGPDIWLITFLCFAVAIGRR